MEDTDAVAVFGGRVGIGGTLFIQGRCRYLEMGCDAKASSGTVSLTNDNRIFYFGREATVIQLATSFSDRGMLRLLIRTACLR
jgi:hypothetical protein